MKFLMMKFFITHKSSINLAHLIYYIIQYGTHTLLYALYQIWII